jgi:hypothetical protein
MKGGKSLGSSPVSTNGMELRKGPSSECETHNPTSLHEYTCEINQKLAELHKTHQMDETILGLTFGPGNANIPIDPTLIHPLTITQSSQSLPIACECHVSEGMGKMGWDWQINDQMEGLTVTALETEEADGPVPLCVQEVPWHASAAPTAVWEQLELLWQQLGDLKAQLDKDLKRGKKTDPQDPVEVAALLDYCTLAKQLHHEGCISPELTASLQIAHTKVSTICEDGNVISKGAWYACTLRSKVKHICNCGELPEQWQGKGAAHASPLDNPAILDAINKFISTLGTGKVSF